MLDDIPPNINSIEINNNSDVIDSYLDSEIESIISEIESLELSLAVKNEESPFDSTFVSRKTKNVNLERKYNE